MFSSYCTATQANRVETRQNDVRNQASDAVEDQIHDVWCWKARLQPHQERYDKHAEVNRMVVPADLTHLCRKPLTKFVPSVPSVSHAGIRAGQQQVCR